MNVLIACEESQTVCKAFREKGHNAFSCDIQEPSGGHPEWHILGDVLPILNGFCHFYTMDGSLHSLDGRWDLIVAHPPCTYLSNAGARHLYRIIDGVHYINKERFVEGLKGKEFFMKFLTADCERIAVENPVPSKIYALPDCSQIIQPYEYGHPWSKKTCLWLKGLPSLKPTSIVDDFKPFCSSGSYSRSHDPKYKGASRRGGSAKSRSKTFEGIAKAMADQWG